MENIQNLPIDIQTSKLLDWLLDRRHCEPRWQNQVKEIREKINEAIQDMPENQEIKELLSGSYIHYFHCLRIVEILKGTEASSKNIFGRYSSQRMKDWQEIVSLYEANNVYLAEACSLLGRSVSYEGPALRKQLLKAQQAQQELSRKDLENQSAAADLRERYYTSCRQYGITGENVSRELQALVKDLPVVLDEVGADAARLEQQIQLYSEFTHFVSDWSEPVLPMLRFAQQKGNATFYEWRSGTAPRLVERPREEEEPAQTLTEDTIDWGDFGKETDSSLMSSGVGVEDGIDWGVTLESHSEQDAIDWGDGDGDVAPVQIEVVDAGTNCPEGVARGEDALMILEHSQSRNQFIDELMELEVFLLQRVCEMSEEGDVVSMSQFQLAPSVLQAQTSAGVQGMLEEVRGLLGRLTSLRMQHLFMIHASPRYVERVCEVLKQKVKQADVLLLKAAMMEEKRKEALQDQSSLEPRLVLLAQRTQQLQRMIEADISKRYHSRPVNLMGVNI